MSYLFMSQPLGLLISLACAAPIHPHMSYARKRRWYYDATQLTLEAVTVIDFGIRELDPIPNIKGIGSFDGLVKFVSIHA